jgi:glycosyltransferase involved in cell wall biosynthesis
MNGPAVSVVVPLYNKEGFIARALESVFAQTFQDFEVIVVDDGSTDGSMNVVSKCTDPRLRVIQQANAGPGAARNRGAWESVSEFVAFLDADDELLPEFLSTNLSNLKENPDCVMSLCSYIEGPKRHISSGFSESNLTRGEWRMPADLNPIVLREICSSVHVYGLIRRTEFRQLGGYYENRSLLGEDTYLLLRILLNHRVYLEPKPLIWYHSEDAELCLHYVHSEAANWHELRQMRPMVPLLTDPKGLRENCPPAYEPLLERYLAYEALSEAQTRASVGDFDTARELRRQFPKMASFKYEYSKLQLKLALPATTRWMSRMKSAGR